MAVLHRAVAALRVIGDDLDPDEVSQLLGAQPSRSERQGEVLRRSGHVRTARTGMWTLDAPVTEPHDFNRQVATLLRALTPDLGTWQRLAARYRVDLFCGWFMREDNEGVCVAPETLLALGSRHIKLGLDIYGPDNEKS
jgi:hypothetical protein